MYSSTSCFRDIGAFIAFLLPPPFQLLYSTICDGGTDPIKARSSLSWQSIQPNYRSSESNFGCFTSNAATTWENIHWSAKQNCIFFSTSWSHPQLSIEPFEQKFLNLMSKTGSNFWVNFGDCRQSSAPTFKIIMDAKSSAATGVSAASSYKSPEKQRNTEKGTWLLLKALIWLSEWICSGDSVLALILFC